MGEVKNDQNLYGQGARVLGEKSMEFSSLARRLAEHKGWVIGVFCDNSFQDWATPADLGFENFSEAWSSPDVLVVPLDANQVRSYSILFEGKVDILVFPYGSMFPMDAMNFYSSHTFQQFLRHGGSVLTTGDIPFALQANQDAYYWGHDRNEKQIVFDRWMAAFGVKYYECAVPPTRNVCNTALLPSLAGVEFTPAKSGVVIVNSSHDPVPKPPHGNVFPERYPARQVIPLVSGTDSYGRAVNTSALLSQDYETGSRRIHFTHTDGAHPLSPSQPQFQQIMQDLLRLLTNRLIIGELEAEYACYRQGECVHIAAELTGFEPEPQDVELVLSISDTNGEVHQEKRSVTIIPGQQTVEFSWQPDCFTADEYQIGLQLVREGCAVSQAENGFVVWSDMDNEPELGIRNEFFTIGSKGCFITGTNYYESTRGEAMWYRPCVSNIIRDYHTMHACGVNMIRPHYHHLKWFKDYLEYTHGRLFPYYAQLADVSSPYPDERGWRIWDLILYLSRKYGVLYNGDLFTLVPSEMGDPRGWFGTVEAVYDREKRVAQKEFLRQLEARYKHIKGITWDLFNEPYGIHEDRVTEWAMDLKSVFDEVDSPRLLTVGGPQFIEGLAYGSPHGIMDEEYIHTLPHPVLMQEVHLDKEEDLIAETEQAALLRRVIVTGVRSGLAGICPWSWTRQMRLWQDSYAHHHTFPMEKWDDRLGMHTHEDGTLKKAGQAFRDLASFLRAIDFVRYDAVHTRCETTRGLLVARLKEEGNGDALYHVQDAQCFGAYALGELMWEGRTLAQGEGYLSFFVREGDFNTAKELFIKGEEACTLSLCRTGATAVELVDLCPDPVKLTDIPVSEKDGKTLIACDAESTRYWIRVRF